MDSSIATYIRAVGPRPAGHLARAIVALALAVATLTWPGTAIAPTPVQAAGGFSNDAIADVALRYVGQLGGQPCSDAGKPRPNNSCKTFVNCVVWIASGGRYYPAPGYQSAFAAVAIEVSSGQAVRGDIIQVGDSDNASPLHTAIVLQNYGGNSFKVVDANWGWDGVVRTHDYTPPSGARFWRLGDVGGGGSSACPGPSLGSPGDAAILSGRQITFSWSDVSCSHNGFTIRVRRDTNFDGSVDGHIVDTGVGGTSYTVTISGYDNQTLYWAVRAANAPAGAAWAYRSFRIQPQAAPSVCPTPALGSPADGAVLTDRRTTFSWAALSGCTFSGYTLRVRADTDFDGPVSGHIVDTGVGGTSYTATIEGRDGQTLYWAVQAANAPAGAAWAYRSFRIQPQAAPTPTPTPAARLLTVSSPLTLTPANPAAGEPFEVRFSVTNPTSAAIAVRQVTGASRGPGCTADDWACLATMFDAPSMFDFTVQPGATVAYAATGVFSKPGAWFVRPAYRDADGWWHTLDLAGSSRVDVMVGRGLDASTTLTPAAPVAGQPVTATTVIRNLSDHAITVPRPGQVARGPGCDSGSWECGTPIDFPAGSRVTIPAGGSSTWTGTRSFPTAGSGYFTQPAIEAGPWWYPIGPAVTFSVAAPTVTTYQEASSTVTYTSGTWRAATSAAYSGARVRFATSRNATATLTFTGHAVAWVTNTGPNYGVARVYVNSKLMKTVDLSGASARHRRTVWELSWASSAKRTVKIVVVGTKGHPRVDIDAFVVTR